MCWIYFQNREQMIMYIVLERKVTQWKNILLIKIVSKISHTNKNQEMWVKILTVSKNILPGLFWHIIA